VRDPRASDWREATAKGRLSDIVACALVAVTLLNGLGPYLRRVGAVETARYDAYWKIHCGDDRTTSRLLGMGTSCVIPSPISVAELTRRERPYVRYVTEVGAGERIVKTAKDLLVLAVACLGLVAAVRGRVPRGIFRVAWPATGLVCVVALDALVAIPYQGPWTTTAGLRSFGFLAVAFAAVAIDLPDGFDRIGQALRGLLILQLALMLPELIHGLPMYGHLPFPTLPRRLAGTLC
jgi:hypothetical protein